jgi:hypothetical protein
MTTDYRRSKVITHAEHQRLMRDETKARQKAERRIAEQEKQP